MKILKVTILFLTVFSFTFNTNAQVKSTEERFKIIDQNNDNIISKAEMIENWKDKKNKKGEILNGELVFYAYDQNRDNQVTAEELGVKPNWAFAKNKLKKSVENNNKPVINKPIDEMSLEEFKEHFKKAKAQNNKAVKNKVLKKFNLIDSDQNGFVSELEMIKFYKGKIDNKGESINGAKLFFGYDRNSNGKVTVNEILKGVNWERVKKKYQSK